MNFKFLRYCYYYSCFFVFFFKHVFHRRIGAIYLRAATLHRQLDSLRIGSQTNFFRWKQLLDYDCALKGGKKKCVWIFSSYSTCSKTTRNKEHFRKTEEKRRLKKNAFLKNFLIHDKRRKQCAFLSSTMEAERVQTRKNKKRDAAETTFDWERQDVLKLSNEEEKWITSPVGCCAKWMWHVSSCET